MSVDYKICVKRKADGKPVAEFYYNALKAVGEACVPGLKTDAENVRGPGAYRLETSDVDADARRLEDRLKAVEKDIFEKKMMVPQSANAEVKESLEQDVLDLEQSWRDALWALEAVSGLKSVVTAFVEDAVEAKGGDEARMAYKYNAEGLPKTPEGYEPSLWADDVYLEVEGSW